MRRGPPMHRATILALLLFATALAGCFGGGDDRFEPGTGYKETGRTIHLRMWVADALAQEVYPGFEANLWAFCAEAFDPADTASQEAIQYWAPAPEDPTWSGANAGKCSVPGPTIRVQQGDRVIVEFTNTHFHCHTIHWHGQYVEWNSDGAPGVTQDSVCPPNPDDPSQSNHFTYDFIASRAGTLWYHCHVDTQFHVMQGLYGVIIVEPQDDRHEPDVDREYILVLGTLTRDLVEATPARKANPHIDHQHAPGQCGASGVPDCQNPPVDVTPDTYIINGRSYPHTMHHTGDPIALDGGTLFMPQTQVWLREGEKVRIRIVNVGETVETMHPHGHDMYVTHRDGNPLPDGFWVDTLTIGPAERYDVVLEGRNPGTWMFHTHINSHETNDGQAPGGMHTMIVYEGWEDRLHSFAAELPGGKPYQPPIQFPADLATSGVRDVGTGVDVEATFDFPVTMPCAVKRIYINVQAQSGSAATQMANDLLMTVTGADGTTLATVDIGAERYGNYTFVAPTNGSVVLGMGDHTVLVNGTAIDTRLTFNVLVDYYDSVDEAAAANACGLNPLHQH